MTGINVVFARVVVEVGCGVLVFLVVSDVNSSSVVVGISVVNSVVDGSIVVVSSVVSSTVVEGSIEVEGSNVVVGSVRSVGVVSSTIVDSVPLGTSNVVDHELSPAVVKVSFVSLLRRTLNEFSLKPIEKHSGKTLQKTEKTTQTLTVYD